MIDYNSGRLFISFFSLGILILYFGTCVLANPIPVYPDPEPTILVVNGAETFEFPIMIIVFIINFCVDVLIVYSGLLLLDYSNVLDEDYILTLPKSIFFGAVALISLFGIILEIIFGAWVGGLFVAATMILVSFLIVGRFILKISRINNLRLGGYALAINILIWIIFYTLI